MQNVEKITFPTNRRFLNPPSTFPRIFIAFPFLFFSFLNWSVNKLTCGAEIFSILSSPCILVVCLFFLPKWKTIYNCSTTHNLYQFFIQRFHFISSGWHAYVCLACEIMWALLLISFCTLFITQQAVAGKNCEKKNKREKEVKEQKPVWNCYHFR